MPEDELKEHVVQGLTHEQQEEERGNRRRMPPRHWRPSTELGLLLADTALLVPSALLGWLRGRGVCPLSGVEGRGG